jgi:hypothetical protein
MPPEPSRPRARPAPAPAPPPAPSLGADGVMVPLVHTREEAARAVSFCKYPPQGQRSVAYPVR